MTLKIKFKKLSENAILPTKSYEKEKNCWDLYAAKDVEIHSFKSTLVPTDLAFEIPDSYQIHLYNRSSMPLKKGLILSNSVGIIDTSYRGNIQGLFHTLPRQEDLHQGNSTMLPEYFLADNPVIIHKGDKIMQMKLIPILDEELEEVEELSETTRGEGGFGSSSL